MDIATVNLAQHVAERRGSRLASLEQGRAANYPLSRFWLRPLAGRFAGLLAPSVVRPWHLSLCGLLAAGAAAAVLMTAPVSGAPMAASLVLLAWFFDRADGQLARRQQTVSRLGAWLDANLDELIDIGLHLAVAAAAASQGSRWAWPCLVAFLAGKYLLMYGLLLDDACRNSPANDQSVGNGLRAVPERHGGRSLQMIMLKALYHLPANADLRVHLLAVAIAGNWLTAELAIVAAYYNLRWLARYGLMIARQGHAAP